MQHQFVASVHHAIIFSFPACTRDATKSSPVVGCVCHFHFPLVREMQRRRPHDPCDYLTFHFPLVREMQQYTIHLYEATDDFHFPLVREMQLKPPGKPTLVPFSFPACTRDATRARRRPMSISRFHFPLVREMQHSISGRISRYAVFISRLYARCNHRAHRLANEGLHFSFPACTRDATGR